MPLYETHKTARARVKAALGLCHRLEHTCLDLQTSIEDTTVRLERTFDMLDLLCVHDLKLTELERQLINVRDVFQQINDSFKKENHYDHNQTYITCYARPK